MALEAVVYPQQEDPSVAGTAYCKEMYSLLGGAAAWGCHDVCLQEEDQNPAALEDQGLHPANKNNWDLSSSSPSVIHHRHQSSWDPNSSSPDHHHPYNKNTHHQSLSGGSSFPPSSTTTTVSGGSRRMRRRTRSTKNKEEIESQRMTHIAVERNRRKQMNEYLALLRSLMPPSYAQKGDQASIVGGSINFVKELEHTLQSMEAQNMNSCNNTNRMAAIPFAEFFAFPQYTTHATSSTQSNNNNNLSTNDNINYDNDVAADIEVNMAESHANVKILTKKRPRQLLKMVSSLQNLRLTVLHLNVSSVDHMVIYSVSVKVEEGSQMNTADEIAAAVNQILLKVEDEAAACFNDIILAD